METIKHLVVGGSWSGEKINVSRDLLGKGYLKLAPKDSPIILNGKEESFDFSFQIVKRIFEEIEYEEYIRFNFFWRMTDGDEVEWNVLRLKSISESDALKMIFEGL